MHPPEYNLALVQAMLEDIESYVLTSELFWPLSQSAPKGMTFPRLTPGTLFLILDELSVQTSEMPPSSQHHYQKLNLQAETLLSKWAAGLGAKATQELRSRFNLWNAYITDLYEKVEPADNYTREVRHRVIFERLLHFARPASDITVHTQAMASLDNLLRSFFRPGELIWDERLRTCYRAQEYWFLYGRPNLPDL